MPRLMSAELEKVTRGNKEVRDALSRYAEVINRLYPTDWDYGREAGVLLTVLHKLQAAGIISIKKEEGKA